MSLILTFSPARTRVVARLLGAGLAASAVVALPSTVGAASAAEPGAVGNHAPSAPQRLTVDDQAHPLNTTPSPRFGWLPQDEDGNEIQSAYELEVTKTSGATVWDSGKVAGAEQAYVRYS